MRVLIATTQVPFMRGGAEVLAGGLLDALVQEGHEAEIVAVPFKWYPAERIVENILACRLLDLSESSGVKVDRVIGLKFPAYLIPHPNKVLWLLHQHRTAYDLWDAPLCDLIHSSNGLSVRDAIHQADNNYLPESQAIYTISRNVTKRLKTYNNIESTALYHPPANADKFYCGEREDFLFFPSRINLIKRQKLIIQSLALTNHKVRVFFSGTPDYLPYMEELVALAQSLNVADRIKWLEYISEDQKRDFYARCRGVVFPPQDEDYGYVTLEAMLSSKPVITLSDSGGPLEFVVHGETGWVASPDAESLAMAMDELWSKPSLAEKRGRAGKAHIDEMGLSWANVVERLLA